MLEKFLDFLYPRTCGICGKICKEELCIKCNYELKKIDRTRIDIYKDRHFTFHSYLFKYEGIIRNKIINYKFREKSYLSGFFAKIIIKNKKICGFIENYDIIIPVPIHKKRNLFRGYNQTELIAKKIAKSCNKQIENKVLIKQKNTVQQSTLNKKQRLDNVKNAYEVQNSQIIINKKVLLFDDIFTTGSTVNECCKILKKAGAIQIDVLTIAKD
jgi:competence protein ComFC